MFEGRLQAATNPLPITTAAPGLSEISPELVLVDPDLRRLALERLRLDCDALDAHKTMHHGMKTDAFAAVPVTPPPAAPPTRAHGEPVRASGAVDMSEARPPRSGGDAVAAVASRPAVAGPAGIRHRPRRLRALYVGGGMLLAAFALAAGFNATGRWPFSPDKRERDLLATSVDRGAAADRTLRTPVPSKPAPAQGATSPAVAEPEPLAPTNRDVSRATVPQTNAPEKRREARPALPSHSRFPEPTRQSSAAPRPAPKPAPSQAQSRPPERPHPPHAAESPAVKAPPPSPARQTRMPIAPGPRQPSSPPLPRQPSSPPLVTPRQAEVDILMSAEGVPKQLIDPETGLLKNLSAHCRPRKATVRGDLASDFICTVRDPSAEAQGLVFHARYRTLAAGRFSILWLPRP